jgi:preprotein translocase subunit SecG
VIAVASVVLVVVAIGLMLAVMLQSARSAGLGGSVGGGAEQIFGKRRGVDAFLSRLTVALGIALFVIALLIAYLHHLGAA